MKETVFYFSTPLGADDGGDDDGNDGDDGDGGGWKNSQSCSTPPLPVQGENIPVRGNPSLRCIEMIEPLGVLKLS